MRLSIPLPCIKGSFGNRLSTYTTQLSVKEIQYILNHDPRSTNWKNLPDEKRSIYQYLQRKTDPNRRDSISSYIEERMNEKSIRIGAFPSISIASQRPLDFTPLNKKGAFEDIDDSVGIAQINPDPQHHKIVIDGLGRLTGALNLLDEGKDELISKISIPVTIYAPSEKHQQLSWSDMGQLFHDFNFKVKPVSKSHAIALDNSDIYIKLANDLGDRDPFRKFGGVAERAASLGKKSTEIVVQSNLVRCVRGACEGEAFQTSNLSNVANPNLTDETFVSILNSITDFFEKIADFMGDEKFCNRESIHLTAAGWQALGVIHHAIAFEKRISIKDREIYYQRIASIDWSRFNPDWQALGLGRAEQDSLTGDLITDHLGRTKISIQGSGSTNRKDLIKYIRKKISL